MGWVCAQYAYPPRKVHQGERAPWTGGTKKQFSAQLLHVSAVRHGRPQPASNKAMCIATWLFTDGNLEVIAPLLHAFSEADGGPYALYRLPPGRQYRSASPPAPLASVRR